MEHRAHARAEDVQLITTKVKKRNVIDLGSPYDSMKDFETTRSYSLQRLRLGARIGSAAHQDVSYTFPFFHSGILPAKCLVTFLQYLHKLHKLALGLFVSLSISLRNCTPPGGQTRVMS